MEGVLEIIGVIGAYFALLLLLAVTVETVLDPLKVLFGLSRMVKPEDAYSEAARWLTDDPTDLAQLKATTLAHYSQALKVNYSSVLERVDKIRAVTDATAATLGLDEPVDEATQGLILQVAAVRDQYSKRENARVSILRILSAGIGIGMAFAFKINSIELLQELPMVHFDSESLIAVYGGMILTGFAASAGSSFWHDKLDRLRAIKHAAQQLGELNKV